MNLIAMIFNVTFDQICCYLISNRPSKIPILPKFPSPQLLLHFWKLLKYFSRGDALQYPYHVRNRISWWKTQKYMDVIRSYVNLFNLIPMMLRNFRKYFLNLFPYIFPLNPFSIFRCPHQMVFRVVNRMSSPSNGHAFSYITFYLPLADAPFIPVHRTGFSDAILIKKGQSQMALPFRFKSPLAPLIIKGE